jgi:hypothetical protein
MVEAPTVEVKIAPSRDHGHLIDGILSLDSPPCRVDGVDGSLWAKFRRN